MRTFKDVIAEARKELPAEIRRAPWEGLKHGVEPLQTDQELKQYLAAYGEMHIEKIRLALSAISDNEFTKPVTVVDWGCGQALASCSLFDWLNEREIALTQIDLVRLIEPSEIALNRARANVASYLGEGHVIPMPCRIGDLTKEGLRVANPTDVTIHLFSNVLDIDSIDLDGLADLIKDSFSGRQILCCVGPLNYGSQRIQEFAAKFGISEDAILKSSKGRLSDGHRTVSLLVFVIENAKVQIAKAEFAPRFITNVPVQDSIVLQRVLKNHQPSDSIVGRLAQFYRMVTELEQMKEPSVKQSLTFPCTEPRPGTLTIDFRSDENFMQAYKQNANKRITKWPKDLLVGIDVLFGQKAYRLLYCILPFEDLNDLGLAKHPVEISLSSFSVSLGSSESLEMPLDQITRLEEELHESDMNWAKLGRLIEETVGNGATIAHLQVQVSFSDKNMALAQIYSELKTLSEKPNLKHINNHPLWIDLLENAEFQNSLAADSIKQIDEDKLICVVPMDDNQRQAVAAILNNRVSVVTGPPGCGKTQLILNLMANALIRGKRVLVTSKNNKAVDNVKERFAEFDPYGCCQRFGTKTQLKEKTVPHLEKLLNQIQSGDPKEVRKVHQSVRKRYIDLCDALDEERNLLVELESLVRQSDKDTEHEKRLRTELLLAQGAAEREKKKS